MATSLIANDRST